MKRGVTMKRRKVLELNKLVLLTPFLSCSGNTGSSLKITPESKRLAKVKRAMLSMQRASWEQGVAVQAFLESGDANMVYLMAKEAVLRQTEEGRLSVVYTDNGVTDPSASGEAVLFAAKKWGDEDLQQGAKKMLAYLLEKAPRTKSGVLSHTLDAKEVWIDSMYMAPPFIAAAGNPKEAMFQLNGMHEILWSPDKKLYSHRWSDDLNRFINEKFWGVGNGWAMAGMCRVLNLLPPDMKQEKELLKERIRNTLDSCLSHLRPDYLFHDVVDDADTFVETNLSQMIAYTIFRGVSENWLDTKYLDTANNMRRAVHNKVDDFGFVQGVCGAPFFNSPGRATEGQAFFILMEAAYEKLRTKL